MDPARRAMVARWTVFCTLASCAAVAAAVSVLVRRDPSGTEAWVVAGALAVATLPLAGVPASVGWYARSLWQSSEGPRRAALAWSIGLSCTWALVAPAWLHRPLRQGDAATVATVALFAAAAAAGILLGRSLWRAGLPTADRPASDHAAWQRADAAVQQAVLVQGVLGLVSLVAVAWFGLAGATDDLLGGLILLWMILALLAPAFVAVVAALAGIWAMVGWNHGRLTPVRGAAAVSLSAALSTLIHTLLTWSVWDPAWLGVVPVACAVAPAVLWLRVLARLRDGAVPREAARRAVRS